MLGVPAGTYVGDLLSWRAAFLSAAGLDLAVLVLLPRLPAEEKVPLGGGLGLVGNAGVRSGLLVIAFLVTGHFAAYTYVRPVLEDVSDVSAPVVGTLPLVYVFASGAGAGRSPRRTLLVISSGSGGTVPCSPCSAVRSWSPGC